MLASKSKNQKAKTYVPTRLFVKVAAATQEEESSDQDKVLQGVKELTEKGHGDEAGNKFTLENVHQSMLKTTHKEVSNHHDSKRTPLTSKQ